MGDKLAKATLESAYNYFLKANLEKYIDEWVAIFRDEVIAHEKHLKELYKKVSADYNPKDVVFVRIPGKNAMILKF